MGTELTKVTFPDTNYIDLNHRVSNVAWDSTNKKLTQTLGKTTTDIVTGETILDPLIPVKTASGSLVSFDDGADLPMPSFICNISAQQDLHGHDHPWVGGAGKNKLSPEYARSKDTTLSGIHQVINTDGSVTLTGTNESSTSNVFFNYSYDNLKNSAQPFEEFVGKQMIFNCVGVSSNIVFALNYFKPDGTYDSIITPSDTTTSADRAFTIPSDCVALRFFIAVRPSATTNVTLYPMLRLATETDATFEPYSNICPISGHTGVDAWVRGKNLLPNEITTATERDVTFTTQSNGKIKVVGTASGSIYHTDICENLSLPIGTHILFYDAMQNCAIQICNREESREYCSVNYNKTSAIFVVDETNKDDMRVRFIIQSGKTLNGETGIMIRQASIQDPTYEPYNPNSQTIQVSWQTEAGEVFGGYVDLVSGKLTANKAYIAVTDESQIQGLVVSADYGSYAILATNGKIDNSNAMCICNMGVSIPFNDRVNSLYVDKDRCYTDDLGRAMIRATNTVSITTKTEMFNRFNGLQLVYELATPIVIQLDGNQIKSLLGNNNAWCDTGDVNVKYITQPYDGISAKYSEYAYNAVNKTGDTMTGRLATKKPINQIITGTGIQGEDKGSGQSPRYFPSTWKFDTGLTAINGDIFTIQIPVAGYSTGVWMSVDNGTTYYPIATQGTTRLQTQYGINTLMTVIFEANGSVETYPKDGGNSAITVTGGIFRVLNFYDSNTNTQMRVYRQNSGYNSDYPLLASRSLASAIGKAGSNGSYSAIYGVMWDDTTKIPTLNPSTGEIKTYSLTVSESRGGNIGKRSFTQGWKNVASADYSHAEGVSTSATASWAHAEGNGTLASGNSAHAEGSDTTATAEESHTEGYANLTTTAALYSHAEGAFNVVSGAYAHAEGNQTTVVNDYSHTEGYKTQTNGDYSHAEGSYTYTNGAYSHAEGASAYTGGSYAHAEGYSTTANGNYSHAEGENTKAIGGTSHAEGSGTYAAGTDSHAEGYYTKAAGNYAHSSGQYTTASGSNSHTEGQYSYTVGNATHAEGSATTAYTNFSHAEGSDSYAAGVASHAEGYNTTASGTYSHAEGSATLASTQAAHAEGNGSRASGPYSHAEGSGTTASAYGSHAEGTGSIATGSASHAEGVSVIASGTNSHAEGAATSASGQNSHAEGTQTTASSNSSHSEGLGTWSRNTGSHAEGLYTTANGAGGHAEGGYTQVEQSWSHAEGYHTYGMGVASHAEGYYTTATHKSQHVFGEYNALDAATSTSSDKRGTYIEIVGNGTASSALSNARTLDWDGNESLSGGITIQGNFTQYSNHIDLTKSNNDITSNNYRYVSFVDKNNKYCGYFESQVRTDGSVATGFYCRNYKTDGTVVTNGMASSVAKNGVITWSVNEAAKFRTAIGAAASSSYLTKTNIKDIDDKEALKILNVKVKSFDYKPGFVVDSDVKNKYYGIIAEDIKDEIPYVVNIPKNYSEETFDESLGLQQDLITVDYVNFIPYLIRTIQLQDKRIKELELKLNK